MLKNVLKTTSLAFLSIALFGADNPWNKVKDLKTGVELRIFKTGAKQPILAMMDEATDERLVIVVKKEQMAIDKDQIDRIDWRPPGSPGRVTKETLTKNDPPGQVAGPAPRGGGSSGGPSTSSSSSVSIGSKPDFETIYRRTSASPVK
jgi:hypothetical protein